MNIQDFNTLALNERIEAILKGTFLMDRLTENHYVKLYNLDNFYVEVYFDDITHCIETVEAFRSTNMLLPYLEWLTVAFNTD